MNATDVLGEENCIGVFGDKRLCKTGKLMYSRMFERGTVCLRRLSDDRATQRRFHRLLEHPKVTPQEITRHGSDRTAQAAAGRHVLAIQDTSELDYSAHAQRTAGLGKTSSSKGLGLFIHPVLVVDARSNECLGIAHQTAWVREDTESRQGKRRPIEEKESMRWLRGAQGAQRCLRQAALVTVVADRESDIYEEWDRIPDERTHLLTRAHHDRQLEGGGTLLSWLASQPVMAGIALDVPARAAGKSYRSTNGARNGARTAHRAHIELRYGRVRILRPNGCQARQASIELTVVEVRELAETVKPGQQPVHWMLLTTHEVQNVEQALQIVEWYRQRWQIEQLFRTLKRQGLELESSQLEHADELLKLASIAVLVAARTLQLVNARDGHTKQPASDAFDDDEIAVLEKLQDKLQGKTDKQKNPHPARSMAWAAWTIARLGGWTGYAKEAKPGPITMLHGQQRFESMVQGWQLAKMWA
ncbi:MAG: IS4 family transposase [Massilia sp.]|nr:IS4 family transposase [Massilia sp.]